MSYGLNRLIVHRCRASCFCFLSTFNHASTCDPRIQATDAKSIKRQRGQNIAASSSNHESNQPRLAFLFFTLLRSLLSSVVRGRSILCLDWPSSRHCLPLLALLVARGSWLVARGLWLVGPGMLFRRLSFGRSSNTSRCKRWTRPMPSPSHAR